MLDKVLGFILFLGICLPATADEIQVNPDSPETYVVQKGDTLWDIAGRFLTQPWRWPEVWRVNPQIENPHLIYPGDVISLSYQGGEPVLTVDRGGAGGAGGGTGAGDRNVKLSPQVRSYEHEDAIPTIPVEAIRHFLSRPMLVTEAEVEAWPYVVASRDRRLVSGEGDRVYVKNLEQNNGERYALYRKGPAFRAGGQPDGRIIGYEALHVGDAAIEKFGDPATAVITSVEREILIGDRLVPVSSREVTSDLMPRPPSGDVEGNIVSVVDGMSEIGQYQVVVLDVGSENGVEVGNVLGVFQSGRVVNDKVPYENQAEHPFVEYLGTGTVSGEEVRLPEEYAGVVLVFRAFGKVSYALVMESVAPFHISDTVRNL